MKKANAQIEYSGDEISTVMCRCPYCGKDQDLYRFSGVAEAVIDDRLEDLDIVVTCYRCGEKFELNDIDR